MNWGANDEISVLQPYENPTVNLLSSHTETNFNVSGSDLR